MNLGWMELLIIALIILVLFGATRLPNAARSLGRSMRIFKSEMDEMKNDNKETSQQQALQQPTAQPTVQTQDVLGQTPQGVQQSAPQPTNPAQQPQQQPQRDYGQGTQQ